MRKRVRFASTAPLTTNESLRAEISQGQLEFSVVRLIEKFGQLHAQPPYIEWYLFLTLDADIAWHSEVESSVVAFIRENFDLANEFSSGCATLFGSSLHDDIRRAEPIALSGLADDTKQRFLMALVPKKIAHALHGQGWNVITKRNLRYGGGAYRAMVTWILYFQWDTRATSQPATVYRESLSTIFEGVGRIEENGALSS